MPTLTDKLEKLEIELRNRLLEMDVVERDRIISQLKNQIVGLEKAEIIQESNSGKKNDYLSEIKNPEAYIILPGKAYGSYSYPDLVVAIEKTHFGSNWSQSHEALHKENAFMLSIRQYIDFLQLLKSGSVYNGRGAKLTSGEVDEILDEILTKREPWRSEWLDAYFKDGNGGLNVSYGHRNVNGQLKPQHTEPLENCVMKNDYVNLFSANRQGLPTVKIHPTMAKEIYFWHPRNEGVARFWTDSGGVYLISRWDPAYSCPSLGVRPARALK